MVQPEKWLPSVCCSRSVRPKSSAGKSSRPRNTRKIDVDGPLRKLESKLRKKLTRELGSESAGDEALISQLYSLSAADLAKKLEDAGCKVKERTIRRGSTKYADWHEYRHPAAPASVATDLGPAGRAGVEEGEAPGPSRAMAVAAEVLSGNLSKRVRGRGTTHIGKTAAEKAAENAADQLARESGIDLPPAE